MVTWFVFFNVWFFAIRSGVIRGHWRWLSMGAFVLGLLILDDIAALELARLIGDD